MMSDVEAAQNARADAFLRRAEHLVRSLSGIADAHVYDDGRGGIRAIDVEPHPDNTAARAARNVQSALLAAFGVAVDLDRIRVRPPDASHADAPADDEPADTDAPVEAAPAAARPRNGNGTAPGEPEAAAVEADEADERDHRRAGPRLVSLDIVRHATGSVACIVAVVVGTDVRRASVEALDLPGAPEHAAAQAVIRAVGAGLELEGVRHVDIAGLDYVIVAAREQLHGRRRAAATLVTRGAAHAAANAATRAARALVPALAT
ncbi:MAG: hypothetical protein P8099_12370 [Gemmatimonadota bacterium]|jgi:hypothetical protein